MPVADEKLSGKRDSKKTPDERTSLLVATRIGYLPSREIVQCPPPVFAVRTMWGGGGRKSTFVVDAGWRLLKGTLLQSAHRDDVITQYADQDSWTLPDGSACRPCGTTRRARSRSRPPDREVPVHLGGAAD